MMPAILLRTAIAGALPETFGFGVRIALVGMTTVFAGLAILAMVLPLLKRMAEGRKKAPAKTGISDVSELTREEVVAMTAAIHAHITRISMMQNAKLTWEMYEKPYTPWRLAGRSRVLMNQSIFRQRNRSR
jgi:Na+-transporting methylmalonyl-CoA/oxaloacetate decarboxylase gamma subunit